MRALSVAALLLSLLTAFVVAWEKEDHEIFQLNDAIRADLGENTTFYSWIGIDPSASQKQLNTAYRKKAADLHPDKARSKFIKQYGREHGVDAKTGELKKPSKREQNAFYKDAEKRFGRFSSVGNIMRKEGRARYDYFLKNGFPKWRGTGYYYSRYRPGVGVVLAGLFIILGGVAHFGALQLSHKRHRDFVDRYIKHARKLAWGDSSGIAGISAMGNGNANGGATGFEGVGQQPQEDNEQVQTWNRKQRRFQEKESKRAGKNPKAAKTAREKGVSTPVEAELTSGPVGAKKRVVAENGKVLIVDSTGNVFVEERTEEGDLMELLLDIHAIEPPTIYDTLLFRLPVWTYKKTVGRFLNPHQAIAEDLADDTFEHETFEDEALCEATALNKVEERERRKPKVRQR